MGEQKVQNAQEQDVKQLLKVRRDKLAELQARGEDPFRLTKYDASHHSQEIKDQFEELEGKDATQEKVMAFATKFDLSGAAN